MIYKVFYQETKDRSPRREQTRSLYVEVDATSELEGRIKVREWLELTYPEYNIEFIQELKEQHLEYEQTHADFKPERI